MSFPRAFLIQAIIFIATLMILTPSFSQVKKGETVSFSGVVKSISKDYKSIVVGNRNVLITSDTKIFNQKGNTLKISDLKSEVYVVVEGLKNPAGFLAKKIVVKKPEAI